MGFQRNNSHVLCVVLSLLALSKSTNANPTCNVLGGRWREGTCFFLQETLATWSEAQQICQASGANLASIASAAENDFVHEHFINPESPYTFRDVRRSPFSLLVTSKAGTSNYADCDGTYVLTSHQINGMTTYVNHEKNRLMFSAQTLGGLGYWAITSTNYLDEILEAEHPSFGGFHYSFANDPTSGWDQYEVTIEDAAWIGLVYNQEADAGQWQWSDNSSVAFENWEEGMPASQVSKASYARCGSIRSDDMQWNDRDCEEQMPFICALKTNPACDELEGVWMDGKCLFMPEATASWEAAHEMCGSQFGGRLAVISSAAENDIVFGLAEETGAWSSYGQVWIGMADDFEGFGKQWLWSDGSTLEFENWVDGEPNNAPAPQGFYGRENCGAMRSSKKWNDVWCHKTLPFVCEIAFDPSCSELGGRWQDGKCFFVPDTVATWEGGEDVCRGHGAHLVSITSESENNVVAGLISERGFIGATDVGAEGVWQWSDSNQTISFSHWARGEPNNYGSEGEHCAMMKSGGSWHDVACDRELHFVCAKFTGERSLPDTVPKLVRQPVIDCNAPWTHRDYGLNGVYDYYYYNGEGTVEVDGYFYWHGFFSANYEPYFDDEPKWGGNHDCYSDFWINWERRPSRWWWN